MAYTAKDFEVFRRNELKMDDTFNFGCAMCGDCCRNRQEPILMTGADVFRIAKSLGVSLEDTIAKFTVGHIGVDSHVPVLVLKERLDGSCSLLRKGRCMVHKDKPAVCALFPLGRYFDPGDNTFHYFKNEPMCRNGQVNGKQWTLKEWLDEFRIEETEAMTAVWHKLLGGLVSVTHQMKEEDISGRMLNVLFGSLYCAYDINAPYIEQVEAHMEIVRRIFAKEFHKTIRYD